MSDATNNGHPTVAQGDWVRVPLARFLKLNVETVDVDPERIYPTVGVLNRGRGLLYRDSVAGSATSYTKLNRIGPGKRACGTRSRLHQRGWAADASG